MAYCEYISRQYIHIENSGGSLCAKYTLYIERIGFASAIGSVSVREAISTSYALAPSTLAALFLS